jgi:hypothetical protein
MQAEELFAARCVLPLINRAYSWRVTDERNGLAVEYYNAKGEKFTSLVVGDDAEQLQEQIAAVRLTQADVEFLESQPVTRLEGGKEVKVLRPFDGVIYEFSIYNVVIAGDLRIANPMHDVKIANPAFDLEYHPELKESERLKDVLTLLTAIEQQAKHTKK